MESGLIFNEIFCEQHEVILGIISDEKFVGIQIKSRIFLGRVSCGSNPVKDSRKILLTHHMVAYYYIDNMQLCL